MTGTKRKRSIKVECKVCGEKVKVAQVEGHVESVHDMTMDEYTRFDPTPFPRPPITTSRPIMPIIEPPTPEPTIQIRLARIESNPYSCSVEARRGMVYHFNKKERYKAIPAPDAWILLGHDVIPAKYAHLRFEKKATKRR